MKSKLTLQVAVVLLVLATALAVGCNQTKPRTDAQVASEVQGKIAGDSSIQNKQMGVQAQNGVITLTGTVATEAERTSAANDAAAVQGVKTVVNNLQVQPTAAQMEQPPAAPSQVAEEPAPAPAKKPAPTRGRTRGGSTTPAYRENQQMAAAPAPVYTQPAAPAAPAVPQHVTVPDGATLAVRLTDSLDSERNHSGDTFRGTLSSPVVVNDNVVIPVNADVEGRVVDAKNAGHFKGQSGLTLELTKLTVNGRSYQIQTNQWSRQGKGRGTNTAQKVGGGAALGAIIGAIAGGGKGAAIGAGVGSAAGGGVQAATRGEQVRLASETLITFRLQSPITVTPASEANRGRHALE